ncbi:MAG: metallopeptidase family protein [Oscillospiraceae bacterium]|nr:metallopeptidase family protein [Oscillospiraceae bacterium]
MFSIDDVNDMLDEIADDMPLELFRHLNGGINLLPDAKRSSADPTGGLYTLGEYRQDQMGRYIVLYYGSIRAVHGHETPNELYSSLKKLLLHELTHHIEALAGERSLEIEDERMIREYLKNEEF